MNIRKALIPVAGHATRLYPITRVVKKGMLPVVDDDGVIKPLIQFNIEEAIRSGIDDICIIVPEGSEGIFREYFSSPDDTLRKTIDAKPELAELFDDIAAMGEKITYVVQHQQEGYGHAVFCARDWASGEPFIVFLGDHIFKSRNAKPCARQLMDVFEKHGVSVSAVNEVPESELPYFGTIAGEFLEGSTEVVRITEIVEKPDAEYARQHLRVPGIREGRYLCWFGMHTFTPGIFETLGYQIENDMRQRGEFQLTSAQELLRQQEGHYAYLMKGERHDIGLPIEYKKTVSRIGPDV